MNNQELEMVPYPRYQLVLVQESTGLDYVHIRLSPAAKALMLEYAQRFPHITHIAHTAEKPSHRYPEKEADRQLAYYIGQLFIEVSQLINDPEEIAEYSLMVAAAIALLGGRLIDEDLVTAFAKPGVEAGEIDASLWGQVDTSCLERRQARYSDGAKSATGMMQRVTKVPLDDSHPFPETQRERQRAHQLRILFEALMNSIGFHDARNFLLASAGRLLQLGVISNTALEKIYQSYVDALNQSRNGRFYTESPPENSDTYNDDEDDSNILSWGNS